MARTTLLQSGELRSLLLRAAGIIASAATALLSIRIFLGFGGNEAETFVAIVGWLAFVPLAQLGFGRPAYAAVRALHSRGTVSPWLLRSLIRLSGGQVILAGAAFTIISQVLASWHATNTGLASIALFTLGLTVMNAGIFQRDLAYATSQERHYEMWEFIRRSAILAAYAAVAAGAPIWAMGTACLFVAVASQWFVGRATLKASTSASQEAPHHWSDLQPRLAVDARRHFFITVNEILIYNLPLVVFTVLHMGPQLLYFGVWLRLFQLLVLPLRIVVDARLNRQITAYHQQQWILVRDGLLTSLLAAGLIAATCLALLYATKGLVLGWIRADIMGADPWLMASLALWCLGNAIQHVFGSFVLSYGAGFAFAMWTSFMTVGAMALAAAVTSVAGLGPGLQLFVLGVVYTIFACSYAIHVKGLLRTATTARTR